MRTRFNFSSVLLFIIFSLLLLVTVNAAPISDDEPTTTITKAVSTTKEPKTPTTPTSTKSTSTTSKSTPTPDPDLDLDIDPSTLTPASILPFDTALSTPFTAPPCRSFLTTLRTSPTYRACLPLSPLLLTSRAFLQAQTVGKSTIDPILDASCNVDFDKCKAYMDSLAREVREGDCAVDFDERQSVVIQAYAAFVSYEVVYKIGCLKDLEDEYCYTSAIEDGGAESLLWHLPLGKGLGGAKVGCSRCVEDVMGVLGGYAGNGSLPLSGVWGEAVEGVNGECGSGFFAMAEGMRSAGMALLSRSVFSMGALAVASALLF
ncbi:hypothetical protein BJ508DRAFT_301961 [Ascobolus immersus RN42]|uniref:DUF7729 domain-containing protein n=1 Tax=Ascobolus immersus RN42 TaxID=1160509 RepID=A0A3N4IQV0_ASCIM|nr:hypothetical protein BJ508DRAFT_301961 [Ascobolus immersus RN42]